MAYQAWAEGAKPQKCRLAPTVIHNGHESEDELCEIFKFSSFLPSKSVKQCLRTASAPAGASPLDPLG